MKKIISLLLSLAMLLTITSGLNLTAYADVQTGKCGDNVTYSLDTSTGVLTISGTGDMADYSGYDDILFYRNSNIKSVIIENSVTSVGDSAFEYCTNLTSVKIPNSVTSIGDYAFDGCTSLTSVTIPNSVTSIGLGAFSDCTSLTSIEVSDNNKNYASVDGVLFNKDKSELITYPAGKADSEYVIPNSVTNIGDFAFYGCTSLTIVTIPNSVISILLGTFDDCTSLTSIDVEKDNPTYLSQDGVLFNKDKSELITYPAGKTDSTYIIPDGVTIIAYAFDSCKNLTRVTIPNSVTNIGNGAFEDCTSLTSINIGNSVTSIGNDAFSGCTSLKDVYYTGSQSDWKKISIGSYNDCLTNATIHYNWSGEFPLVTNEDETSFTVYNSTAIIDGANDVNLKLKSVNMNIAENSSQFDKKKVVKKNDIKGKEMTEAQLQTK